MGSEGTITAWVDEAMRRQPVPSGLWQTGDWGPQSIIERPGSENIPMMAHSVKMGEEFQAGRIKADTWAAALGYATLQPLYGRETCAGNVYHDWIDLPAEHIRLEAVANGQQQIADLFRRRARAIMTLAALCAQDRNRLVGTPHPTPWNEHVAAPGEQMPYPSAYCGLSRAYVSPKVNNSRTTNGRFNELVEMEQNSGGQHLAVALGQIKPNQCTGWTGAWLPNLQFVHGRAALFGLTSGERALLLQVVEAPETLTRTDYETIASWLDWNGTTRLIAVTVEWIAFEDGERVFFAHDSINNGSTNMCMGVVLRPDGYRQWLANSQPLREKEKGVRLECSFDEQARTLTSRITQGYNGDPSKQHEEYTLQLSRSKILSHGRLAPRRPQLLVGGDPTSPPPPEPPPTEPPLPGPPPSTVQTYDMLNFFRQDRIAPDERLRNVSMSVIGNRIFLVKDAIGSAMDLLVFDERAIWRISTEHHDHRGDPTAFKGQYGMEPLTEIVCPRYVEFDSDQPPGKLWSQAMPDTTYRLWSNCEPERTGNVGFGLAALWGPYRAGKPGLESWREPIGGVIPDDALCLALAWFWGGPGPTEMPNKEEFINALGWGPVAWHHYLWGPGGYGEPYRSTLNKNVIRSPKVLPQFPCDERLLDPSYIYPTP